jgi:tyrosyl-tRNA synthetase
MKKTLTLAALLFTSLLIANAQNTTNNQMTDRIQELEDKLALKELVDTFSNLSDVKDVASQILLFREDATVHTFVSGNRVANLKGRKEMENAFAPFLARFETVYHFNGQHTVKLNGDKATGVLYCTVTLIGMQDGKRMKTTIGVSYNDEYARRNGKWFIANRISNFNWQDTEEIK